MSTQLADHVQKFMLEEYSWQQELDDLKSFMCSEVEIDGMRVPRYGLHSIFCQKMPFFAYDHPALIAEFGDTAFTDGMHCFFSTPFLKEIFNKDKCTDQASKNSLIFLAMHEISHALFRHFTRMLDLPDRHLVNIAQDMSINTRLLKDFVYNTNNNLNTLFPLSPALENDEYAGFNKDDIEKYVEKSEEDIYRILKKDPKYNKPNQGQGQPGQGQPGQGKTGQGQPGQGKTGQGQPGQGQPGQGQPGQGKPGEGGMGTDHLVSMNDLIDALKRAGLDHVLEKLEIPQTPQEQKQAMDDQMAEVVNATNKMSNIQSILGDRTPGGHIADAAKEMVGKLAKPKVTWKMAIKNAIFGNGMKFSQSFDHASDLWHFDLNGMGIRDRIYDGAFIPSKPSGFVIALLDTSGSMSTHKDINESVSEIFGLVQNNKQTAPDVIMLCADTVGRGKPLVITPQNAESIIRNQVSIDGRGGTNLTKGIIDALDNEEVKRRLKAGQKINSMLFFTDLGDDAPLRENLPENLPKNFTYMATSGNYNDDFANKVKSYANVVSMGDRQEVDLNMETAKTPRKRNII